MSLIKPRDGNATSGASLPRNFGVDVLQVLALKKKTWIVVRTSGTHQDLYGNPSKKNGMLC